LAPARAPSPTPSPSPSPSPTPTPAPTPSPTPQPSPEPSPSAAASPSPAAASAAPTPQSRHDQIYDLVGDVWNCETSGGNTATHAYILQDDGSILLRNILQTPHGSFEIDERYHYDVDKADWVSRTEDGSYSATASRWLGEKWVFNGFDRDKAVNAEVRMVYTRLADKAFRRDFQRRENGEWRTFTLETCAR
jgi:hypothetical protein